MDNTPSRLSNAVEKPPSDQDEEQFTHTGGKIESLADILEIVSRPREFLGEIIDVDTDQHHPTPLGRNRHGAPRPFPHGIWFRGQANAHLPAIPSVFRNKTRDDEGNEIAQFFDEREMFTDIRLKASNIDLRGFNNLELMCLMQHHALPTRLMDWSESPLVAAFFATYQQYYSMTPFHVQKEIGRSMATSEDAALYVMNSYRLNSLTNLSLHDDFNICHPKDIDVVLRSLMAEHVYLENVLTKIREVEYVSSDRVADDVYGMIDKLTQFLSNGPYDLATGAAAIFGDESVSVFLNRMRAPVAVIPRRDHARMHAQLSCFTMHGGKNLYNRIIRDHKWSEIKKRSSWHFLPDPLHLSQINTDPTQLLSTDTYSEGNWIGKQFIKKFKISRCAVSRIMIELDRMGINESMIYPDIENQSRYVKRRWETIKRDKPIWSLPKIPTSFSSRTANEHSINYMKTLYGYNPDSTD